MRLGLVIYGSLNSRSGGYLYDRQLLRNLHKQGDEVYVLSQSWGGYARRLLQNYGRHRQQRLQQLRLDIEIQDELNHPSLALHNHGNRSHLVVSLVHHLRANEVHPQPQLRLYQIIERHYLRTVDALICNSYATLAAVQSLSGLKRPAIVAYPGRESEPLPMDSQTLIDRAMQPGPLRLLFMGNLIPRKGLHYLLYALASMAPDFCQLTIAGDDTADHRYAMRVRKLAYKLGVHQRLQWLGYVPDQQALTLRCQHHLMVIPSQHEGFGIAYLEGMGQGMPAIAGVDGGACELIEEGKTGYLVHSGDVPALVMRIRALHQQRSLLAEMSLNARRRYLDHPTWSDSAHRIRRFLIDLLPDQT